MTIQFSPTARLYTAILALAVTFLLLILWGVGNGRKNAQSKTVLNRVSALKQGLEYFYADNSRYPTADEFARSEVMLNYLSNYPQSNDITGESCPQTLAYSRPLPDSYLLDFCLLSDMEGYQTGWNRLKQSK